MQRYLPTLINRKTGRKTILIKLEDMPTLTPIQWHKFKKGCRKTVKVRYIAGIVKQSGKKGWLYPYTPTPSDNEHYFLLDVYGEKFVYSTKSAYGIAETMGQLKLIITDGKRWAGAIAFAAGARISYAPAVHDAEDITHHMTTGDLKAIKKAIREWLIEEGINR